MSRSCKFQRFDCHKSVDINYDTILGIGKMQNYNRGKEHQHEIRRNFRNQKSLTELNSKHQNPDHRGASRSIRRQLGGYGKNRTVERYIPDI
jgi:hypothetical protein